MSYNLGEFNRNGQIGEEQAADVAAEALDLNAEPVAEETGEEAAPAADEAEVVDADGDGHDDATGEFVEGNQEAADPESEAATDVDGEAA